MFLVAGKHGKRRSCRWKNQIANERNDCAATPIVWRNHARRRLVDATVTGLCRLIDFYRLFHMGGVSGTKLFFRQLHLALLFARNTRRLPPQLVWTKTYVVPALANLLSRVVGSLGAGWISGDLLLLSRRLLQGILGGSAGMHGRRAEKKLLGRAFVPVDHAKRSSLLSLPRALLSAGSSVRCLE